MDEFLVIIRSQNVPQPTQLAPSDPIPASISDVPLTKAPLEETKTPINVVTTTPGEQFQLQQGLSSNSKRITK